MALQLCLQQYKDKSKPVCQRVLSSCQLYASGSQMPFWLQRFWSAPQFLPSLKTQHVSWEECLSYNFFPFFFYTRGNGSRAKVTNIYKKKACCCCSFKAKKGSKLCSNNFFTSSSWGLMTDTPRKVKTRGERRSHLWSVSMGGGEEALLAGAGGGCRGAVSVSMCAEQLCTPQPGADNLHPAAGPSGGIKQTLTITVKVTHHHPFHIRSKFNCEVRNSIFHQSSVNWDVVLQSTLMPSLVSQWDTGFILNHCGQVKNHHRANSGLKASWPIKWLKEQGDWSILA